MSQVEGAGSEMRRIRPVDGVAFQGHVHRGALLVLALSVQSVVDPLVSFRDDCGWGCAFVAGQRIVAFGCCSCSTLRGNYIYNRKWGSSDHPFLRAHTARKGRTSCGVKGLV